MNENYVTWGLIAFVGIVVAFVLDSLRNLREDLAANRTVSVDEPTPVPPARKFPTNTRTQWDR